MEATPRFWEAQRQARVIEAGYRGIITGVVSWYPDERLYCCEFMWVGRGGAIVLAMDPLDPTLAVQKAAVRLREALADDLHERKEE